MNTVEMKAAMHRIDATQPVEWQPLHYLAAACLEDAIRIVRTHGQRQIDRDWNRPIDTILKSEVAWFNSDQRGWPLDFVPVCELLGLDPQATRHEVLSFLSAAPKEQRGFKLPHACPTRRFGVNGRRPKSQGPARFGS